MIHELIHKRYSPRAFSEKKIDDEVLFGLLEAARWAPSSMNEQPWRFIIVKKDDSENFDKLLNVLNSGNRIWAANAPVLILTLAKQVSDYSGKQNSHALYDLGNSVAQLTFQATAVDLYVRQMGGFDPEKAVSFFGIPENYLPVSVLAIGYKGNPETLPERLRLKEAETRSRKQINEIAFTGRFGNPLNPEETISPYKKTG